jgi:subtilisin-like proprotein convertase family protein
MMRTVAGIQSKWRALAVAAACAGLLGALAAPAGAKTFANTAPIAIPQTGLTMGNASPYPSKINVSGLGPSVSDVNAKFSNLSHTFPNDIDALLVAPTGKSVVLMSDTPGGNVPGGNPPCAIDATNVTLNFDDAAPSGIPDATGLASGTYKPTDDDRNLCGSNPADDWPSPAPLAPYGTTLSNFKGTDPNGTWSLYVVDDNVGDTGNMAGGWSLDISAALSPNASPSDFSFGKLKRNKKKGTATLSVDVPGPGTLTLGGKGVKHQRLGRGGATASKDVDQAGVVKLKVKAKGAKKKKLQDTGKVKLKLQVTYTPTGGDPNTETKPAKLIDNNG